MYKLLPILLLFSIKLQAQSPQKVERITVEQHRLGWYLEQKTAWKNIVEKNPRNGEAWKNYYLATRVAGQVAGGDWPVKEMNGIIAELQKAMPNSFEYYYLSAFNNGVDFMKNSICYRKHMKLIPPAQSLMKNLPFTMN